MKTISQVSSITGVSKRTLQYYDKIGLLSPCEYTKSGYRLYGEKELKKLQIIMLFKELQFPLKSIRLMINNESFDFDKALNSQIELLKLKEERLKKIISLAENLKEKGVNIMDFGAFDNKKIEEYKKRAKASFGNTKEYKEYEEKSKNREKESETDLSIKLMGIFAKIGKIKNEDYKSDNAIKLIEELKGFINDNYYTCSNDMLLSLGQMYLSDEFKQNIDKSGGEGTAEFTNKAIRFYCGKE